jgi:hypothetical protein
MTSALVPRRGTYAGVFLVCSATLLYELLLTRVFSVTMWYHFAFMAVSIAMFGMTVGAIAVYLGRERLPPETIDRQLASASLLFAATLVPSFLAHLVIPFAPEVSILGFYSVALTYVSIAVPFVLSGVVVSLALTRYPRHVGRVYAADLTGASVACVTFVYLLRITDAPTAVVATASLAGLAPFWFGALRDSRRIALGAAILEIVLVAWVGYGTWRSWRADPLVRLAYVKQGIEPTPIYEKWNSFSRVAVFGDPSKPQPPTGVAMSRTFVPKRLVPYLVMNIDGTAATWITRFGGTAAELDFLRADLVNMVHQLRADARVLVVGVGGGRDILSALAFGQREVVGVEINDDIVSALTGRFGDFAGHLERRPGVRIVNDEARSWLARSPESFDVIQVSMIDTWAATAAGAFTFTENSLYTVEAWRTFFAHLTPSGVLTFSRWYFGTLPGETYRLVRLAAASLRQSGVAEPRRHMLLLKQSSVSSAIGVATILVGREPFSEADVAKVREVANQLGFDLLLTPTQAVDPVWGELTEAESPVVARSPLDLSPPTDDRPFFFHTLRWRSLFRSNLYEQGVTSFNVKAVFILAALLAVSVVLTLLCIVVPLLLTVDRAALRGSQPLFVFFAAIGVGFMLVEISQMQRLNVFLGHPTYGFSAALFSLLLSSGIGSLTTSSARDRIGSRSRLLLLLTTLAAFGALTPVVVSALAGAETPQRIAAAVAMLAPAGFFMGMAFPLGMEVASRRSEGLTPWLWGINGAMSVCASVVALAIALTWGISAAFWCGVGCYVIAVAAYARAEG